LDDGFIGSKQKLALFNETASFFLVSFCGQILLLQSFILDMSIVCGLSFYFKFV